MWTSARASAVSSLQVLYAKNLTNEKNTGLNYRIVTDYILFMAEQQKKDTTPKTQRNIFY